MVKFIIGPAKIQKSAKTSLDKVNGALGKLGSAGLITVETNRYKLGNLDNMMQNYEIIQKVEHQVEMVIKKIIKCYTDLNAKNDPNKLLVDSRKSGPSKNRVF